MHAREAFDLRVATMRAVALGRRPLGIVASIWIFAVAAALPLCSGVKNVASHRYPDQQAWLHLRNKDSWPQAHVVPGDVLPGGVLLYAHGRSATETLYRAVRLGSKGGLHAAFGDRGGEAFNARADGFSLTCCSCHPASFDERCCGSSLGRDCVCV